MDRFVSGEVTNKFAMIPKTNIADITEVEELRDELKNMINHDRSSNLAEHADIQLHIHAIDKKHTHDIMDIYDKLDNTAYVTQKHLNILKQVLASRFFRFINFFGGWYHFVLKCDNVSHFKPYCLIEPSNGRANSRESMKEFWREYRDYLDKHEADRAQYGTLPKLINTNVWINSQCELYVK